MISQPSIRFRPFLRKRRRRRPQPANLIRMGFYLTNSFPPPMVLTPKKNGLKFLTKTLLP
ncbi:MAG: hypothetical protein A3I38_03075 [Candidatus Wildermuthbacteria bacterium RIFCSPLOWO2_02_FULL_47_10]|nr:MAG: hypothetical protein A3I38_03075 [Candidatus Wildermuthbacteria bacterium RIFCSPLOWO2_02_FULL_47_10]